VYCGLLCIALGQAEKTDSMAEKNWIQSLLQLVTSCGPLAKAPEEESDAAAPVASTPASAQAPVATGDEVRVMDPKCGYRYVLDGDLVQPFDFHMPVVRELRSAFELRSFDIVIATYPK
jgi:hypothetical protein